MSHSTNYRDTFILVAEDSTAEAGTVPPERAGKPTIAGLMYAMISENAYTFTSDDVIFGVHAERNGIPEEELDAARDAYFSTGRPCLRASDLTKRFGWGVHHDGDGHVALYGVETPEYARFRDAPGGVKVLRAMRSKR